MKKFIVIIGMLVFSFVFSIHNTKAIEPKKEELKEGFYYEEESNIANETYDYSIVRVSSYEKGFVVLGSGKDDDATISHLDFYINYPYVALYDENGKVWSALDKTIGFGEYRDAVVVGEEVLAFGSYEDGTGKVKLLLTCFNKYGNVKTRVTFDDNKSSFGNYILYEDNHYYLVGTTNATHFLVDTNDVSGKIFILKMNSNFQQEKIIFLHNKDNSKIYDACICNDYIYIFGRLVGSGIYENESSYSVDALFSIDCTLSYIEHKMITHFKHMKIGANGDGVYLFSSNNNMDNLILKEYNSHLELVETSRPFADYQYQIDSLSVGTSINVSPVSVYGVCKNNGKYYEICSSIDRNSVVNVVIEREITPNTKSDGVSYTNGYINLFSNLDTTKDYKKMIYIKEEENDCFCNGIKAERELEELNTNLFGKYNQNVTYHYYNLDIFTNRDIFIPLRISIIDKGIYDREIELTFNGNGYLDGEKIDSGFVVKEEGRHVLIINGKNETRTFTFEIKKLTIDEEFFNTENIDISFVKDSGIKEIIENKDVFSSAKLKMNNFNNGVKVNYFLIIGLVFIGLALGLFIPFERIIMKGKGHKNE